MSGLTNTAEISNEGGLQPISSTSSSGLNLQLFKLGPVVHVALGATVASLVLVATTVTVVVIAARATYNSPTVVDDKETTFKTTPKDIYVLKNDKDEKGANLTVISVTQPPYGKVEILGEGQYIRYTPNGIGQSGPHYAGDVLFTYEAMNEKISAIANVTVTVLNHPPEPVNLEYVLSKNSLDNAANVFGDKDKNGLMTVDLDSDDMEIVAVSNPANGKVKISTDKKKVLYTPNQNFKSVDTLTYTISDGNDTATAKVTYQILNDAPKANPDRSEGPKNNIIAKLDLLKNDFDKNGDELTIVEIRNSGIGQAFITENGKFAEYWPVKGAYGDSFEYTISDGELTSASYCTVNLFNKAPTAGSVTVTVPKNSNAFQIPFPYGDPDKFETLNVTIGTTVGTSSLSKTSQSVVDVFFPGYDRYIEYTNNTWTLSYTPTAGQIYSETFKYTVSDGIATTDGTITVNVQNTAPIAVNDAVTVNKNSNANLIDVLANDYDPNGDSIQLVSVQTASAQGGVVSISGTRVSYTPKATFQGTDTFTYIIKDLYPSDPSKELQATGTVTVTVVNRNPVAVNDVYTVPRGQSLSLSVLTNDSDPDSDPFSINTWSVSVSGVTLTKSGNDLVYTALTGAPYTDSFTYNIIDNGNGVSNDATVTINAVNLAPVAVDDTATVLWNRTVTINILANDNDPNGAADKAGLTISQITQNPTNGAITQDAAKKTVQYAPNAGFVGTETFKYTTVDPYGAVSNEATVTITVTNDAPVAVNDVYSVNWGKTIDMAVLVNDNDPNSDPFAIKSQTSSKAVIVGDIIRYTATAMSGQETFTYTITDWNKQSTATVTVNILNTPPVAQNDASSVHWNSNTGVTLNVLANDDDADGDAITVNNVYGLDSALGTATINSNTTITFIPSKTQKGVVQFNYQITDTVATATAQVTITVTNANTPTSSDKSFSYHWRTTSTRVDVLSSLTDADGDSLSIITTQQPASGSLNTVLDGTTGLRYYNYSQSPSTFTGPVSWKYRISDGLDQSVESTVTGNIYNNAPVAKSYTGTYIPYSTAVLAGTTWSVVSDATDADSADVPFLTVLSFTQPTNGTVTFDSVTGKLKYVARAGTEGPDSFTYIIRDGQANSNTATISLTVGSPSLGATDKSYEYHWRNVTSGANIDLVVSPNVTVNGLWVKLVNVTGANTFIQSPSSGSLVFASATVKDAGTAYVYGVKYTPNTGFIGVDTFIVKTSSIDNTQQSQIRATVTITNTPPTTSPISVTTHWNTTLNVNVLASCSDANADPTSITGVGAASCGSVSYNSGTQRAVFVPPNQITTCTFTYTCSDTIATSTSTVTVSVTNTPPVTSVKYGYVHWKTHAAGYTITDLRVGDSDANGDSLSITVVGSPSPSSAGTTSRNGNSATLTANSGSTFVNNNVTFSYTETDGASSSFGLVNLYIYDNAPIGRSDYYAFVGTVPQQTRNLPVLNNDNDPDSQDTIRIIGVNYQGSSTVTFNNTHIIYTPSAGLIGNETFTYEITDGMMNVVGIQVIVSLSNQVPVAMPDYISIMWNSNGVLNPTTNDVDPENNLPFTSVITSNPSSGSVTLVSNIATYTPSSQVVYTATIGGQRQLNDTFQYRVTDSYGRSSIGTVTVNIKNTPPVAVSDAYVFSKDAANTVRILPVLVNDNDADGNTITVQSITYSSGNGATISTNGTHIFYQPSSTFRNAVDTFNYTISDGQLTSSPAVVTVQYTNSAPTCQSFSKTVAKNTRYVWNLFTEASPSDPNGDSLTFSLSGSNVYDKANVSLSNGNATFISNPRRSGTFTFQYTVSDGIASSSACTGTITIVNNAPVANVDPYTFAKGTTSVQFDMTLNDVDSDGDSLTITGIQDRDNRINNPAIGGSVSLSGNFVTYNINTTFQSPPTLLLYYNITDGDLDNPRTASSYANITITNKIPKATDDLFTTTFNTNIQILISDLLKNDISAEGLVGSNIQFYSLVDCATLDSRYFCLGGSPALNVPSTGYITMPYKLDYCQETKFMYCINQLGDKSSTSCATVTVQYSDCVCKRPVDLIYAIQISSSITNNNVNNAINFIQNTINRLTITPTTVNVGIVWWSTTGVTHLPLTGDSQYASSIISDLRKAGTYAKNNIIAGLDQAVAAALNTSRLQPDGRPSPKVIAILSDGLVNDPCSQYSNCECDSCVNGGPGIKTGTCAYLPTTGGQFCYPYADPSTKAKDIQSWKLGVNGKTSNWKLISLGIGEQLHFFNDKGWNLVKKMNYDASKTIDTPWNDLKVSVPQLTDAICNAY